MIPDRELQSSTSDALENYVSKELMVTDIGVLKCNETQGEEATVGMTHPSSRLPLPPLFNK